MENMTNKDYYVQGVNDAIKVIKEAEKNPDDQTKLSLKVGKELEKLKKFNHGCN